MDWSLVSLTDFLERQRRYHRIRVSITTRGWFIVIAPYIRVCLVSPCFFIGDLSVVDPPPPPQDAMYKLFFRRRQMLRLFITFNYFLVRSEPRVDVGGVGATCWAYGRRSLRRVMYIRGLRH